MSISRSSTIKVRVGRSGTNVNARDKRRRAARLKVRSNAAMEAGIARKHAAEVIEQRRADNKARETQCANTNED